jgi:hypothetical protein
MENMKKDNADKIPEDEMTKVDALLAEARTLKDKEDATKEELDTEIERFNTEFQELMGKYAAADNTAHPDADDVVDDKTEEAEVFDADD